MKIKRHQNKNEYLYTSQNKWVRNFKKELVPYVDLNNTIDPKDHFLFLKNEYENNSTRIPWIDTENFHYSKIVIVSDGFGFEEKHKFLANLPNDIAIIAINGTLKKWKVTTRSPTFYLAINPYEECLQYLPRNRFFPKCILSSRTNGEFVRAYKGSKYRYKPVNEAGYSGMSDKEVDYQIDDYRNPVCAAIGIAYRFAVEQLLLFCCDDVFETERPGARQLENKLWMYPQQDISHGLVDANLYWLSTGIFPVSVKDYSSGPVYKNATYINENEILEFLEVKNVKKE